MGVVFITFKGLLKIDMVSASSPFNCDTIKIERLEEVIQRYWKNGNLTISDDNSVIVEKKSLRTSAERGGEKKAYLSHNIYAKEGMLTATRPKLKRSKIQLVKTGKSMFKIGEGQPQPYDRITARYKKKQEDEMVATSDCSGFTRLVAGEEPSGIYRGNGERREITAPDKDGEKYKTQLKDFYGIG